MHLSTRTENWIEKRATPWVGKRGKKLFPGLWRWNSHWPRQANQRRSGKNLRRSDATQASPHRKSTRSNRRIKLELGRRRWRRQWRIPSGLQESRSGVTRHARVLQADHNNLKKPPSQRSNAKGPKLFGPSPLVWLRWVVCDSNAGPAGLKSRMKTLRCAATTKQYYKTYASFTRMRSPPHQPKGFIPLP